MPLPPLHETSLLKVWGSPGHGRPSVCVISAHGEATGTNFEIPRGVVLHYYSDPGQPANLATQNADILKIASGQFQRTNGFPKSEEGSDKPNYVLSKFEEYHEGYGGVLGSLYETAVLKPLSVVKKDPERGTYDQIRGAVRSGVAAAGVSLVNQIPPPVRLTMDIVTIRFRPGHPDSSLDAVVRELVALGYKNIHCPFCRG
jgi:hypothetical protein